MKIKKRPYKWGWFYWLKKYRADKELLALEPVKIDYRWHRIADYDSY